MDDTTAIPQMLEASTPLDSRALSLRRRAELRLAASHASIATSLADHAERVARKAARRIGDGGASAADRMEALRRRITERRTAAGGTVGPADGAGATASYGIGTSRGIGDRGHEPLDSIGVGLAASATPTSNEDAKMHPSAAEEIMDGCTAEGVDGGGPNHAADHAAAAWAWHARVAGDAGGGGRHLSDG